MKGVRDALILESQSIQGEFLAQERRNWLPILIPPLVHRLNNALLVVMGGAGGVTSDEDQASALAEYEHLTFALRSLALFSKSHPDSSGSTDVSKLIQAVRCLADPLAKARGVEFEIRAPGGGLPARASLMRLQQWVLCLVLELIQEISGRAGREMRLDDATIEVPILRLSVHALEHGLALGVSMDRPTEERQPVEDFLEASQDWLQESGIQWSERQIGGAYSLRLLLPIPDGTLSREAPLPTSAPRREELTLVEPDEVQRELFGDFLRGESIRVRSLKRIDELSDAQLRAGLLLLDRDMVLANPSFRERVQLSRGDLSSVLLLGTPTQDALEGPWAQVHCLPKACRPAELLYRVRALF